MLSRRMPKELPSLLCVMKKKKWQGQLLFSNGRNQRGRIIVKSWEVGVTLYDMNSFLGIEGGKRLGESR